MDTELEESVLSFDAEPENGIVLAATSAVDNSESHIFENTSDLDLINILYVNRIPVVADAQKPTLDKIIEDLTLWESWELTRVETEVQKKVTAEQLPSDNTVDSKSKRTNYRVKVQDYFRRNAPWLGVTKDATESTSKLDTDKGINLDVLHMLLATSPLPQDTQFTTLLKAIGPGFVAANNMVQPFALTVVDYNYDSSLSDFRPALTTLTFQVVIEDVPKGGKELQRKATLNYTIQQANFNIDQWERAKPKPDQVELGKSLLPQRQLTLLRTPQQADK